MVKVVNNNPHGLPDPCRYTFPRLHHFHHKCTICFVSVPREWPLIIAHGKAKGKILHQECVAGAKTSLLASRDLLPIDHASEGHFLILVSFSLAFLTSPNANCDQEWWVRFTPVLIEPFNLASIPLDLFNTTHITSPLTTCNCING